MATWQEVRPIDDNDYDWWAIASDSGGSNLIAAVMNGGRVCTSSDYGWDIGIQCLWRSLPLLYQVPAGLL